MSLELLKSVRGLVQKWGTKEGKGKEGRKEGRGARVEGLAHYLRKLVFLFFFVLSFLLFSNSFFRTVDLVGWRKRKRLGARVGGALIGDTCAFFFFFSFN